MSTASQQFVARVSLLVRDYDEAIGYYRDSLGFELVQDIDMGKGKRWVVVRPPGDGQCCLVLAQASSDEQRALIGRQGGGRVWLFLYTSNIDYDVERYRKAGVRFMEEMRHEPYGKVIVFEDIYGNHWDLLQPAN